MFLFFLVRTRKLFPSLENSLSFRLVGIFFSRMGKKTKQNQRDIWHHQFRSILQLKLQTIWFVWLEWLDEGVCLQKANTPGMYTCSAALTANTWSNGAHELNNTGWNDAVSAGRSGTRASLSSVLRKNESRAVFQEVWQLGEHVPYWTFHCVCSFFRW